MYGKYEGKSLRPGVGGQFAREVDALVRKGIPLQEARAIAAKHGRDKYGAEKMAAYAKAGRLRAEREKRKKKK
jgi:ATP phosphoribosyltransferase regulatory subunit HisZ